MTNIGQAEFKKKTFTIEKSIKFTHKEVDWVDVRIDSNNFKIDIILRVNLKDGGEKDLNSWDKVSKDAVNYYNDIPVQVRTKNFEELRDEALDGISTYWSRTYDRTSQKCTIINGEKWELLVKVIYMENGMKTPKLYILQIRKKQILPVHITTNSIGSYIITQDIHTTLSGNQLQKTKLFM